MMKSRVMILGATSSGKSTLAAAINGASGVVKKTQEVIYEAHTIDTPGEYLENPKMYRYIISTAQNASTVIFAVDQSRKRCVYPPGFASCFTCRVVGVVTKADEGVDNRDWCLEQLKMMGVKEPYYIVSAKENLGVEALKENIFGSR